MPTTTTAATSWGATGYVRDNELRAKADAADATDAARLARLPDQCRAYADVLDVDALECMGEVARLYKAEAMCPVRLSTPDLARRLKTSERDTEDRIERLVKAGALERRRRIAQDPVFIPLARGPVVASKAERDIAAVRDMAEDALRAINGQEPVQRAAPATLPFAPGSVMRGLQGRN